MDKDSKSFANQPKVASIEDDEDDQLDESLVRHLNGFIRTVQEPADLIDLNSVWGPGAPLLDLLITVVTRLMKCQLHIKS